MSRKRQIGGNPPSVIQIVNGGAGFPMPGLPPALPLIMPDPLSSVLAVLNSNPYLIGVFYLFLNLGGRFLSLELTKRQEWFLAQPYIRPFILFAVMFISTRNLAVAFWTTVGILSVLWFFANENSALCLIPSWKEKKSDNNYDATMSKIKKIEIPEDGHHDTMSKEADHHVLDHSVEEHQDVEEHAHIDNPKDTYINSIKDDPVPNNIKENFANY